MYISFPLAKRMLIGCIIPSVLIYVLYRITFFIQPFFKFLQRKRFVKEIALCKLAVVLTEELQLCRSLNALYDTFKTYFLCNRNNVPEHYFLFEVILFACFGEKTFVYFENVPRNILYKRE